MKNLKKYLYLVLALLLCLSLAACGGGDGADDDYADDPSDAPGSFEGMVRDDSQLLSNLSMYYGVWLGEDNSELIVEKNEDDNEMRYALYDTGEEVTASGWIQYVYEYGADYFYNEHDGVAHHSRFDDDGTLQIDSFGAFTKVSGDVPGENTGDTGYESLAGEWYPDGDADADCVIEIWADGDWTFMERLGDDEMYTAMDWGTIRANENGDGSYIAVSDNADRYYGITVVSEDSIYWGAEDGYDYFYQKLS